MVTNTEPFYKIIDLNHNNDPWLMMVHGFSHNHTYFRNQILEFQNEYRILLTDLRGHGNSQCDDGPFGVEEYADDVMAIVEAEEMENIRFWGTHTGSAIGLVLALRHPDRFKALILEGTFLPGFPMPRVGELLNRARLFAKTNSVQDALNDWWKNADWFNYANEHPKACRADEFRTLTMEFSGRPWLSEIIGKPVMPVADHLEEIRQPVFFYNGESDLVDFKLAAQKMKERLPNGQGAVIKNAGGFPGWENPVEVNSLVKMFLLEQNS